MNISSVSRVSSFIPSTPGQSSELKALEKQKAILQDQREKIKQSDMDSKLKQETLQTLDEQIAQIESQIREQKTKKLNASDTENSKTNSSTSDTSGATKGDSGEKTDIVNSKNMISATSDYSELKVMKRVRTKLQGDLRIATSSGECPEAGAGIQARINQVETGMAEKSGKIRGDLKEAAEDIKDAKTPAEEIQETNDEDKIEKENVTSEKADTQEHESQGEDPEILPIGSYIDVWA